MSIRAIVVEQFRRPSGVLGHLAGWVMSHRASNRHRGRWTVDLLELHPGDRVLEIGCGPGLALQACLETHPDISAVGLDHSEVMIRQATRRNAAAVRAGRLHLVVGSISLLPRIGKYFTKCLMVNVAQFLPDRVDSLARIAAVLEPNAVVAITFQPRNPGAGAEDGRAFAESVAEDLWNAGFENPVIHELELRPIPAFSVLAKATGTAPVGG